MTSRRQPWPYPRTQEQVIQTVMVTLAVIFVGLIGTAAQAKRYHSKPLTPGTVQEAATSLSGYASEAASLSDQAAHGRAPQNYQAAYLQQLSKQAQDITNFIGSHNTPDNVAAAAHQLNAQGKQLEHLLNQTADQSNPAQLQANSQAFRQLQQQLQVSGENL
jgi:hypothetical protein